MNGPKHPQHVTDSNRPDKILRTQVYTIRAKEPVHFVSEEVMKNENEFLKIEDYLGPRKISINNIAINLRSTPIDRAHQTFELQDFENALLEKISPVLQSKLPTIQLSHSQQEVYDKKESANKNSKLTEPNISDQEITAL